MVFLIQQYIEILSRKNKYQISTQYILNKIFKISSLKQQYIEILFRKDRYRILT